jgi:predicted metal-dependent phosphoesterase TrpH
MGRDAGLAALALTDHDCLDGLKAFAAAAAGFEPVPGVEVSARFRNADIHILGLFVDPTDPALRDRLAGLQAARRERSRAMVERLRAVDIPITLEQVSRHAGEGAVGRPHMALALVELGVAASVDDAFRRYLRPRTPGYVPRPGPAPEEAVAWIHQAGGVAVLAHPGLMREAGWVDRFAEAGLDGLEVWHPKHDDGARAAWMDAARRLDLVPSGGSDYHGAAVGDAQVGQEPVPLESLERLRERSR